jgi:alpha-N-arabinofuranosidase
MNITAKAFLLLAAVSGLGFSQTNQIVSKNKLIVYADSGKSTISRHIYGQFSEHLGRGIYEGIWVGENSPIPNTRGIRNDVLAALKEIKVPNLRWPGGCFADEYHWMDGIGPRDQRPTMINTHWGGVTEDNSFGTHEFLDLCEQLGTEPYICGNVGSGSVEEMSKWVEYITFDGKSPMADLRRKNGREQPWKVKYWGVGNENWGCGGNMTAEFYSDLYKRYATYCRNYGENRLFKIAGGGYGDLLHWTEVLMTQVNRSLMSGVSLHQYTVDGTWQKMKSATKFDEGEYFDLMKKSLEMDSILIRHLKIMDKYDPENHVALAVDEWGAWHASEPGSTPGFLYQQNTLRDAFVAALTFNIFHKHARRVKMANIAQTINVLQAMILTDKEKMLLTPTYHVFDLYKVHQDAFFLPLDLKTEDYENNGQAIPALSVSCSKAQDGSINVSIVNVHPRKDIPLECELRGARLSHVSGKILTASQLNSHNTFDQPDNVIIRDFDKASLKNNVLKIEMPAKSVVVLNVK